MLLHKQASHIDLQRDILSSRGIQPEMFMPETAGEVFCTKMRMDEKLVTL